jgi:hypothetical protein
MTNYIPYQDGQPLSERYAWWAQKEIGHQNLNIDSYAKLIQQEYQKLINNKISLEEFESNTPEIDEETLLNYIRNRIIEWYPI